jgi:hypothetical protein
MADPPPLRPGEACVFCTIQPRHPHAFGLCAMCDAALTLGELEIVRELRETERGNELVDVLRHRGAGPSSGVVYDITVL